MVDEIVSGFTNEEAMVALQKESEEAIAACMRDKGWEYTPATQSAGMSFSEEDMRGGLSETEYAAQYGYGIVSQPEVTGMDSDGEYVDPNADYLASLGEGDSAAYYEDLYGDTSQYDDLDEDDEIPAHDPTTAGCVGQASSGSSMNDFAKLYEDPQYKDLFTQIDATYTTAQADPKVAEAKADWVTCMADAGVPESTDPDTVQEAVWERQSALHGKEDGTSPEPAELDALKADEIKLAVADLACKESSQYTKAVTQAQIEAETTFYNANKELVDNFLEAARAATGAATPAK